MDTFNLCSKKLKTLLSCMLQTGNPWTFLKVSGFADLLPGARLREVLMDHFKGLEMSETEGKQLLWWLAQYEEKMGSDSDMPALVQSSSSESEQGDQHHEAEPDSGDEGYSEFAIAAAAHLTATDADS